MILVALVVILKVATSCNSGEYFEEDCISCGKLVEHCGACDSTRCYMCNDGHYLHNNQCIPGVYIARCELIETPPDCVFCKDADSNCSSCKFWRKTCGGCGENKCLRCVHMIEYRSGGFVQVSQDQVVKTVDFQTISASTEYFKCLESRNLQAEVSVLVNEPTQEAPLTLNVELVSGELDSNQEFALFLWNEHVRIDIQKVGDSVNKYKCSSREKKGEVWVEGCSLIESFHHFTEPISIDSMSIVAETDCYPSFIALTLLFFVVALFLLILQVNRGCLDTHIVKEGIEYFDWRYTDDLSKAYEDVQNQPDQVVVIESTNTIEDESFESKQSFFSVVRSHHLVLGQFDDYYYPKRTRANLFFLESSLVLFSVWLFHSLLPGDFILSILLSLLIVQVVTYTVEFVFFQLKIIPPFLSVILLGLSVLTASAVAVSSALNCSSAGWLQLISLGIDWLLVQTLVAFCKPLICFASHH